MVARGEGHDDRSDDRAGANADGARSLDRRRHQRRIQGHAGRRDRDGCDRAGHKPGACARQDCRSIRTGPATCSPRCWWPRACADPIRRMRWATPRQRFSRCWSAPRRAAPRKCVLSKARKNSFTQGAGSMLSPSERKLFAFPGGREKFGAIEKAVRAVEDGEEHSAIGRMCDMDVAARPPHKITCAYATFRNPPAIPRA